MSSVFLCAGRLSHGAGTSVLVKSFSSWAEFAVGGSLIAIGALGINEARNWKAEDVSMELSPSEVLYCNAF